MPDNLHSVSAPQDTICAPATVPGGALGVIRVSGPATFSSVSAISSLRCNHVGANTIHYARVFAVNKCDDQEREVVDEVMVAVFRAPHSYTGEDCVEISCHGSRYIVSCILELLTKSGCRMARPGEFTLRAYLNGKMDLSQAEAVADLIASNNRATHQLAMSQLRGGISSELSCLREQLLRLTSLLELELDFSDHEDLEFADRNELRALATTIDGHISRLARSFETGKAVKEGIPVAIVGKTNVGKSTLLNALLGDDRAIVSDVHGTTRDTIEDTADFNGVTFRFIDTAGIRKTTDEVEQIGIGRTFQAIEKARVVLWLVDQQPTDEEQQTMAELTEGKALVVVCNKVDKGASVDESSFSIPHHSIHKISAKLGTNLNLLETAICEAANIPSLSSTDVVVTNARHYDALIRARNPLLHVIDGLDEGLSGDLLAEDLHDVLDILSEITGGQITNQETLNNIFSHFCVGK